ncbi:serine hydrolase [Streptomyces goshikiensis]|uniref:serine hydrolase n=1 Tax=Streptomyces goshikiensis TaxID=1942 RepID=UPI0036B521AD
MAEAATGRPYEDLLRELVYRPLGLHRTSLPLDCRLPRPFLHGYAVAPPTPPEDVSEAFGASGAWASGGIVSTPRKPHPARATAHRPGGVRLRPPQGRVRRPRSARGATPPPTRRRGAGCSGARAALAAQRFPRRPGQPRPVGPVRAAGRPGQ